MNRITVIVFLSTIMAFGCKQKPTQYSAEQTKQYNENLVKANRGLVEKDQALILECIKRNGYTMQQSPTGLWYEIIKQGTGELAKAGQKVQLKYEVKLLDGTLCYTSDSLGFKSFRVGQGGVETGLEEAVLLLGEGAAARLILPPYLAFGLLGDENKIPPRTSVIYNIELLKLTNQ